MLGWSTASPVASSVTVKVIAVPSPSSRRSAPGGTTTNTRGVAVSFGAILTRSPGCPAIVSRASGRPSTETRIVFSAWSLLRSFSV